jgi:hypothetical protein
MNDRQRVLAYLEENGEVTSYEIRIKGLSGNPSQRINELRDEGHKIDGEDFRRDGRPCTRYTLLPANQACPVEGARGGPVRLGASETVPRGSSRGQGIVPVPEPDQRAAATSGAGCGSPGSDGSRAVTAIPTLFELDADRPSNYYEGEAA